MDLDLNELPFGTKKYSLEMLQPFGSFKKNNFDCVSYSRAVKNACCMHSCGRGKEINNKGEIFVYMFVPIVLIIKKKTISFFIFLR